MNKANFNLQLNGRDCGVMSLSEAIGLSDFHCGRYEGVKVRGWVNAGSSGAMCYQVAANGDRIILSQIESVQKDTQ